MNTDKDFYYQGFVDKCLACGLEKSAADLLYKEGGFWDKIFGRGVGHIIRGGIKAKRGIGAGLKYLEEGTGNVLKTTGDLVYDTAVGTAKAYNKAKVDAVKGINEVMREYGLKEFAVPASMVGSAARGFHPFKGTVDFVANHPILGSLGLFSLGAFLTNWANKSGKDEKKAKLPALTPAERIMHERQYRGMDLPGLGLDPRFLDGSFYDSYLYM